MSIEESAKELEYPSAPVNVRVQGFRVPRLGLCGSCRTGRVASLALVLGFCLLAFDFARAAWHGVYHDGPIALYITPNKKVYQVGDSFRLSVTATNTSDRDLLIKRGWNEQLVFYHIHPETGEQIEWPGQVLMATRMDSTDVVRLGPSQSYTVDRYVRTWIPEDVTTFQFRAKLVGIKDYARRFDMWQDVAWSNAIAVAVGFRS